MSRVSFKIGNAGPNGKRIRDPRNRRASASGQAMIESIVSIILFTMMLGAVMSISVYLYFQQALVTAAREGARYAALNSELGVAATESTGVTAVKTYVQNEIQQLTGQTLNAGTDTISVSTPRQSSNQTAGERTVTVSINWSLTNPVGVGRMMTALGGDGSRFETIPVRASATMRYEE